MATYQKPSGETSVRRLAPYGLVLAAGDWLVAAQDHDDEQVAFFTSDWRRKRAEEEFPMIRFLPVREQHGLAA